MKKIFLLATSALLLLAGCAKEVSGPNGEGGLQEVTFTANMAGDATKAAVDGDGAAANVNRCIMEIYYGDALFTRMYSIVSDKKASFTTQLVANRTYTVAFWADHVESTSALETDLYYTTDADQSNGGLQAIALKGTYAGNIDARDAFFHSNEYTIAQAGSAFNATLYRPFAQVNVITTDWDKVSTVSSLKPDKVDVTIQSPLTKFNAVTGEASADPNVTSLNYNADLYTAPAPVQPVSTTEKTLSMDYLFAASDKAVIDIAWKAQKTDNDEVVHSFSNIPYQRNYRTNIKGALLTTTGQWNVTVDPIWAGEHTQIVEVKDIQSANAAISANSTAKTIDVKFSAEPSDSGVPTGESTSTSRAILTTPVAEGATLSIEVATDTKALYVGDYQYDYKVDQTVDANAATVNINVPSTGSIGTLVINAPSKTVYINGKKVSSVGTITNLDAITSDNTLVIEANQTVTNLTIRQGGLEIHGTVGAATVTVAEGKHVYVRDCENLSEAVYNVLKPYIAEGYAGIYGYTTSDKWDIRPTTGYVASIGNVWYQTLADAFGAVTEGQTITLIKDCETGAEYTINNALALSTNNVTFNLNEKSLTVTNNFSFILAGNNITLKNGNIVAGSAADKQCGIISYSVTIAALSAETYVNDVTLDGLNVTGGIRFGGDETVQYKGGATAGVVKNCTVGSGDFYCIWAEQNSTVTVESGTFTNKHIYGCAVSAADGSTISLKGGTYNDNTGFDKHVADGYEAKAQGTDPETWKVVEKEDPYSRTVSSVDALSQVLSEFNAAEDEVTYTITLTEGDYSLGGLVINQIQKAKKFIIQGTGTVNLNYTGSDGFIFKVHSTSERAINTSVTFKNLKFNSGTAYAVKFTQEGNMHYVHDISFDHCDFSNNTATAVGAPDSGHWATGLIFSYCNLVGGSGYLYNGYGVDYSDQQGTKTFLTVDHCNTTTSATKTFINANNEGSIVISNCDIFTYNDYTIRSDGGNITVTNSKFASSYSGSDDGGILVLRKDKTPTVSVDADTQFNQTSEKIHDIYCGDDNVTVTITGRESATIGKGQTKNYHDFQ